MKYLIAILSVFFQVIALADNCNLENIKFIERPIVAGDASTFTYKYALRKGIDSKKPTVIFLPGGPGLPSIGSPNPKVPPEFSAIQTDPRGVGCNSPTGNTIYPDEFYRTENLASDVVAIVAAESLSHYIIYGESFGTQLGTVVTAQIQAAGLPLPKALVLEGVLGRAFYPKEAARGYIDIWNKIMTSLSTGAVSSLSQPNPLGFTGSVWGAVFETYALYGTIPAGFIAKNLLALMDPAFSDEQRQQLIGILEKKKVSTALDINGDRLYKQIACNEIVDDYGPENNFVLTAGKLTQISQGYCEGIKLSRPFDSAKYQVRVPLYYFEGTLDPATPLTQARFHFDNQVSAPKVFITVEDGGHAALSLSASPCLGKIWNKIAEGQIDLAEEIQSCGLTLKQEVRNQNLLTN